MRDIQHHLASTLSVELSVGTISRTRRRGLLRLSRVWQHASAGGVLFPVVYHGRDSGRWSASITESPPARPISRSASTWTGSSTWLKDLGPGRGRSLLEGRLVCAELANRGVKDVLIVEGAPPARERSARGNVTGSPAFPKRTQAVLAPGHGPHLRRYHPVPRPWMRFVSYGDRRKVAAALKADLHRPAPGGRLAGSDRLLCLRHGGQAPFRR